MGLDAHDLSTYCSFYEQAASSVARPRAPDVVSSDMLQTHLFTQHPSLPQLSRRQAVAPQSTAQHQHASADTFGLWQISYTQREGEAREPEGEGAAMVQQLARPRSQGVDAFLAASQIQLFKWVHSNYFWVLL